MDVKHLFSERAQKNEEFSTSIILPTEREFNSVKGFIDVFPDLVSLDYCSPKFMKYLGDFVGYPWLDTEDPEVQREIYKRLVEIYHNKGSLDLFTKAMARAWSENYALGDMTYYHGPIKESDWSISYPRDDMFRFDYSKYDCAKYADGVTVALGIIDIDVSIWNERVETYLDRIIPAGIKYGLTISKYFDDGSGHIIYPYTADNMIVHSLEPTMALAYEPGIVFIFDKRKYDNAIWCGRELNKYRVAEKKVYKTIVEPIYPKDLTYNVKDLACFPLGPKDTYPIYEGGIAPTDLTDTTVWGKIRGGS